MSLMGQAEPGAAFLARPLFGQCRRWLQASLAAGMDSFPVIDQELRPNSSFPYRRIHTSDPLLPVAFPESSRSLVGVGLALPGKHRLITAHTPIADVCAVNRGPRCLCSHVGAACFLARLACVHRPPSCYSDGVSQPLMHSGDQPPDSLRYIGAGHPGRCIGKKSHDYASPAPLWCGKGPI